jgi:hypothetical protein
LAFAAAGYDSATMQETVILTPEGETLVTDELRRVINSRPELWTAYIAVDENEASALLAAAEKRFGADRTALLSARTRGDMRSPELAIAFDVADQVGLFNEAATAWHELRTELSLAPVAVTIIAFSPPRLHSAALEALGRGMVEANSELESKVKRAVADAKPQIDERTVCVRALTQAARAMRRSLEQDRPPPELSDSELAFTELQAVEGMHLDPAREEIQTALVSALRRASDRLGPYPGGRLGSFRGPEDQANVVEEIAPTPSDLVEIARTAGRALGHAHASSDGRLDAVMALTRVLNGSDSQ